MARAPGSYLVLDPGRNMGWASCLAGGEKLKHGTWRFNQETPGEAYFTFTQFMRRTLESMPDPLVCIELMTIVTHGDDDRIDAEQVMFSSGWPTHAQTLCHIMALRQPDFVAIQSWRAKTHTKTRTPDSMKGASQVERSKWFKERAKEYCDARGWSYGSADEAEALCILDYTRIVHEPGYAFDRGRAYQQESLF
ncbi:hypothetical protein J2045_003400 [Peteryoungia aggregata LMG 23059]|uniref:RuvC-like resolvase n=1 Tax=Peteryoungia aggregata LMG 23059 TaxID=1368425 RepID=A0ABU0GAH0_9HYPH|nr:hypothetical protein [Peteryoungia aggregata]MDQ0422352.1 hypothetical protein [Peteryoungia aggregata LMG 23059]